MVLPEDGCVKSRKCQKERKKEGKQERNILSKQSNN
jgi:hypothetical protein